MSSVEASRLMFLSTCYLLADLRVTDGSRLRTYGLKANDRVDVLLGHVRGDNLGTYKLLTWTRSFTYGMTRSVYQRDSDDGVVLL